MALISHAICITHEWKAKISEYIVFYFSLQAKMSVSNVNILTRSFKLIYMWYHEQQAVLTKHALALNCMRVLIRSNIVENSLPTFDAMNHYFYVVVLVIPWTQWPPSLSPNSKKFIVGKFDIVFFSSFSFVARISKKEQTNGTQYRPLSFRIEITYLQFIWSSTLIYFIIIYLYSVVCVFFPASLSYASLSISYDCVVWWKISLPLFLSRVYTKLDYD